MFHLYPFRQIAWKLDLIFIETVHCIHHNKHLQLNFHKNRVSLSLYPEYWSWCCVDCHSDHNNIYMCLHSSCCLTPPASLTCCTPSMPAFPTPWPCTTMTCSFYTSCACRVASLTCCTPSMPAFPTPWPCTTMTCSCYTSCACRVASLTCCTPSMPAFPTPWPYNNHLFLLY